MIDFFVSYRSTDEPHAAALVAQILCGRVGREKVFLDTTSTPAGAHFPRALWEALMSCRAMVAVIGERWLEPTTDGARRIDDPMDYVRREVATALERDITLVPALVADAVLPEARHLPPDVAGLAERQAVRLRRREQLADVERLAGLLVPSAQASGRAPSGTVVNNTFLDTVTAQTIGMSFGWPPPGGTVTDDPGPDATADDEPDPSPGPPLPSDLGGPPEDRPTPRRRASTSAGVDADTPEAVIRNVVNNYFDGEVLAGMVASGSGGTGRAGQSTRDRSAARRRGHRLVRRYSGPGCFADARTALRAKHVVVVEGQAGSDGEPAPSRCCAR